MSHTVNATHLAQFIRLRSCQRYLRFALVGDERDPMQKRWNTPPQQLSPLLADEGSRFEEDVVAALREGDEAVHVLTKKEPPAVVAQWLRAVQEPLVLVQAHVRGEVGNFSLGGYADIVRLSRRPDGAIDIYVADIKSSRAEKMEHRFQVAAYAYILRQMAAEQGEIVGNLYGGVLHKQDDDALPVFDPHTPTFDLAPYFTALEQLLLHEDGTVNRILAAPFDELGYTLGYWCDGCRFNALCFFDSAERQDLALVPVLSNMQRRALQRGGVETLTELAALMLTPPAKQYEMLPNPAKAEIVQQLENDWAVAADLPLLVQRAQSVRARFDTALRQNSRLYTNDWGTLPDEANNVGLVKLFFDAGSDYLRQRVYLLSARIDGTLGSRTVVRYTTEPPTQRSERTLLLDWLRDVIQAVLAVAGSTAVPLHLYCYNGLDQITLLEALKRHLADVTTLIPGFFDFMTQSPALEQNVITFLAGELHNRQNLGLTCMPLHDAAEKATVWENRQPVRFRWVKDGKDFRQLFKRQLHDNWRNVVRQHDGRIIPAPRGVPRNDPARASIEASSRFNSQLPLEYPYAAWGALPTGDSIAQRRYLDGFRDVSWEDIQQYAALRVDALAHIERSFTYKSRFIEKPPVNLAALVSGSTVAPTLAQSLREFIYMEHYATLQQKLQLYALPVGRRVGSGVALLLRYLRRDHLRGVELFALAADQLGVDPIQTMHGFRPKEGSWMVLNAADSAGSRLKNGQLAIIQEIDGTQIALEVISHRLGRDDFKLWHQTDLALTRGHLYTIDENSDDFNAGKHVTALHHADENVFYRWLNTLPPRRSLPANWRLQADSFVELIDRLSAPHLLEPPQRSVIGAHLGEPILLVQGPPGTGKSHTIGWAAISRLLLRWATGEPCRIAVSSKTHNAVNIVLRSIAEKWDLLVAARQAPTLGLLGLPIVKIVNDMEDEAPDGVERVVPRHMRGEQLTERLAQSPYAVFGGTPGGLYNLARYQVTRAGDMDWSHKWFDLIIIDEASQTSQPEGILATSWLREDGQVLVVGDHRQMPPIIQHEWETEEKRSVMFNNPHLSLFDALRQREVPTEQLTRSFRLHEVIAQFLHENVYMHDNIRFFSTRTDLIAPIPLTGTWVDVVMDPNCPIVVIEHAEQASQQYNETELALLEPLIRCCTEELGLDGQHGVGIVVPHRAQKSLLRGRFPALAAANGIDTVERFQGGERDVIIVSATASDPDYVLAEADFLLDINRLNVALSRPKKKLIVIASRSVTQLLVSDLNTFENAVIWKRLFHQFATESLYDGREAQTRIRVRGRRVKAAA